MRRRLCLIESFFRTRGCKARRDSKASTYEKTLFTKLMKSYKPALAGEWFDGLSPGDDTYFMLNLQNHRQCPAGGFYFVRFFGPCFDARGAGSDWTADRPVHPPSIPPIVVKASAILHCDLALQDAFQAVFPSISRGRLTTFSCRHRFVHLSFRNNSAFAKTKLWGVFCGVRLWRPNC